MTGQFSTKSDQAGDNFLPGRNISPQMTKEIEIVFFANLF